MQEASIECASFSENMTSETFVCFIFHSYSWSLSRLLWLHLIQPLLIVRRWNLTMWSSTQAIDKSLKGHLHWMKAKAKVKKIKEIWERSNAFFTCAQCKWALRTSLLIHYVNKKMVEGFKLLGHHIMSLDRMIDKFYWKRECSYFVKN